MKIYHFIILISVMVLLSCIKHNPLDNSPKLPPETQIGANTFGCLVNGQVWLPKGSGLLYGLTCDYNAGIVINANNINNNDFIKLNVTNIFSDTIFVINNLFNINGIQNFYYRKNSNYYYPDSIRTGSFNLKKLDTINHIMSGTFWFDAIDSINNNTIQIRDGRFDVKYIP